MRSLRNSRYAAALNCWRTSTSTRRTLEQQRLDAARDTAARRKEDAWFLWRQLQLRARFEKMLGVNPRLRLRPAFAVWRARRALTKRGATMGWLGARHAVTALSSTQLNRGRGNGDRLDGLVGPYPHGALHLTPHGAPPSQVAVWAAGAGVLAEARGTRRKQNKQLRQLRRGDRAVVCSRGRWMTT